MWTSLFMKNRKSLGFHEISTDCKMKTRAPPPPSRRQQSFSKAHSPPGGWVGGAGTQEALTVFVKKPTMNHSLRAELEIEKKLATTLPGPGCFGSGTKPLGMDEGMHRCPLAGHKRHQTTAPWMADVRSTWKLIGNCQTITCQALSNRRHLGRNEEGC